MVHLAATDEPVLQLYTGLLPSGARLESSPKPAARRAFGCDSEDEAGAKPGSAQMS